MNTIDIFSELEIKKDVSELIRKSANAVLDEHALSFDCHIDITITDNKEIHAMNLEYRQKDYATDVLSFHMVEFYNGKFLDDLMFCKDPETEKVALGDMIISYDKVLEQAKEFEHSNEREFAFLTVHSVLHLLGYDHEQNEQDGDIMRFMEKKILTKLGILR